MGKIGILYLILLSYLIGQLDMTENLINQNLLLITSTQRY